MTHNSLDRFLALDLAAYFATGVAPTLLTPEHERRALSPLVAAMELDDWVVEWGEAGDASATKSGKRERLRAIPALYDRTAVPADWRNSSMFSTFDLDKDLPSCIALLPL